MKTGSRIDRLFFAGLSTSKGAVLQGDMFQQTFLEMLEAHCFVIAQKLYWVVVLRSTFQNMLAGVTKSRPN